MHSVIARRIVVAPAAAEAAGTVEGARSDGRAETALDVLRFDTAYERALACSTRRDT